MTTQKPKRGPGRPRNTASKVRMPLSVELDVEHDYIKFARGMDDNTVLRALLWHAAENNYQPFPFNKRIRQVTTETPKTTTNEESNNDERNQGQDEN